MTLRTLSRGIAAALLFTAVPTIMPTAATAANPGDMAVPAAFNSPAYPQRGRFLLVDAASARLFMVEDGQVRDSMRLIVGKAGAQTPTIASQIYYATLNPYWNVPDDLARKIIAPRVLSDGVGYLKAHGYEVLDSFGDPRRPDGRHGGHVFNLGHGINQHTPPEHVSALVEAVHAHSRTLRQAG